MLGFHPDAVICLRPLSLTNHTFSVSIARLKIESRQNSCSSSSSSAVWREEEGGVCLHSQLPFSNLSLLLLLLSSSLPSAYLCPSLHHLLNPPTEQPLNPNPSYICIGLTALMKSLPPSLPSVSPLLRKAPPPPSSSSSGKEGRRAQNLSSHKSRTEDVSPPSHITVTYSWWEWELQ